MADNEQITDSSEASDAPLVTTATTNTHEESDSTTMETLNADNLGKFLAQLAIKFLLASFLVNSVVQSSGCSQSSIFPPVLCKIIFLQSLLPVPSFWKQKVAPRYFRFLQELF